MDAVDVQVARARPAAGRLADPKPDSNVASLWAIHPDPLEVCEAAVRVLALAQTPARMPRGTRLTLHSR
ncbi:MAG: hypothetical protein ACREUZ_22265 [Burkholderiales bacterium]